MRREPADRSPSGYMAVTREALVSDEPVHSEQDEVPWPQRVLDNLWLMIAISVLVPTVLYLVWGLWEVAELPRWGGGG